MDPKSHTNLVVDLGSSAWVDELLEFHDALRHHEIIMCFFIFVEKMPASLFLKTHCLIDDTQLLIPLKDLPTGSGQARSLDQTGCPQRLYEILSHLGYLCEIFVSIAFCLLLLLLLQDDCFFRDRFFGVSSDHLHSSSN